MNHLKTGNAFFGRGSYKDNKYNGKELQETGMYSYGWREYMPDIGKWNGIDQLAEAYQMASPYSYVLNNPISFLDPDGRDVKPTSGGYEFSGSDLQNVMTYLQQNGSPRKLMSALSAWEEGNSGGGDFWRYFGSWNAFGATGGDVGGSLYASTWGDGAMGATVNDIQEIVFTRTKITDIHSKWFEQQQLEASFRKPGKAQMLGGLGDFLGLFDIGGEVISNWKPENRYLAMGAGALAAVALRKPGLALKEESNLWRIGAYKEMRGIEKGLDAHHVGQSAVMKKLVAGYDHKLAPTILVPKLGHTIGTGVVSRSTAGFTSARQVVARDIFELRRVYKAQGIPNSALQELIQMNKTMYPAAFLK